MSPKTRLQGLNSTLRNLLLAVELNATIFSRGRYRAQITLAKYSWQNVMSTVSKGQIPDLPKGTADKTYIKFQIAIENTDSSQIVDIFDYGQGGEDKYGISPTGEGVGNTVGEPTGIVIDPSDIPRVRWAMQQVEQSQNKPEDRLAVSLLNRHLALRRHLVDFAETEEGMNFPQAVASLDNLSPTQMQSVLQWAEKLQGMWAKNPDYPDWLSFGGTAFAGFVGNEAFIQFDQPSTRTVTATKQALQSLGMHVHMSKSDSSSRAKGESLASEMCTLNAHDIAVVLSRAATNEEEQAELAQLLADPTDAPAHISLGGGEHHPTQTLGELMLFMEEYGCESCDIKELRKKTTDNPPTIVFMGHTADKRADMALMFFILKELPAWKVTNLIPDEKYKPDLGVAESDTFKTTIDPNLEDQHIVATLTEGADYVYTSNSAKTAGGSGGAVDEHGYVLSHDVVVANNLKVMAPLPASGELDPKIFTSPQSLIQKQMQNKIAIIASLVAHQLSAREAR